MLFPIYQSVQCANGHCRHTYFVKTEDLIRAASRAACPLCDAVTQFAEAQIQRTDISPQTKNDWGILRNIAVGIGLALAVHKVIQWADS